MNSLYDAVYNPSRLQGFPLNLQTPYMPTPTASNTGADIFDNGEGQGGQGANTSSGNVAGAVAGMTGAGTPGFGTSKSLGNHLANIAVGLGMLSGPVGAVLAGGRIAGTMIAAPERDRVIGLNDVLNAVIGRGDPQFGPEVTDAVLGTEPNPANPFGMTQKGGVLSEVETPGPPAETKGADPSYGGVYRHGGRVRGPLSYFR